MMAWVFFRCDSVGAAVRHLSVMFGGGTASEQIYSVMFYMTWDKVFFLVIGVLVSLLPAERFRALTALSAQRPAPWVRAGALVGFVYALSLIAANGFNPFIYFRF
jgi:alginate O-acetyltransferase complex protein AlgI